MPNFISDNSGECMDLEEKGLSFTGCVNRQIIFSAGIRNLG